MSAAAGPATMAEAGGGPHRRRRRVALVLGAALLAWTAALFAVASVRFVDRVAGPPRPVGVMGWNPGEYASNRLARLLAAVEPRLPSGSVVLISAGHERRGEEFFLSLWAAYHLPRHRVIGAHHPGAAAGEYLVVFDAPPEAPAGGEALLRHPLGTLYRLPASGR